MMALVMGQAVKAKHYPRVVNLLRECEQLGVLTSSHVTFAVTAQIGLNDIPAAKQMILSSLRQAKFFSIF
jgi:hypothetical protein